MYSKPKGCKYPSCNCHYGTGCKGNKEYLERLERVQKESND